MDRTELPAHVIRTLGLADVWADPYYLEPAPPQPEPPREQPAGEMQFPVWEE